MARVVADWKSKLKDVPDQVIKQYEPLVLQSFNRLKKILGRSRFSYWELELHSVGLVAIAEAYLHYDAWVKAEKGREKYNFAYFAKVVIIRRQIGVMGDLSSFKNGKMKKWAANPLDLSTSFEDTVPNTEGLTVGDEMFCRKTKTPDQMMELEEAFDNLVRGYEDTRTVLMLAMMLVEGVTLEEAASPFGLTRVNASRMVTAFCEWLKEWKYEERLKHKTVREIQDAILIAVADSRVTVDLK